MIRSIHPMNQGDEDAIGADFLDRRHFSLQYLTSFQFFAHDFRHSMGRLQHSQIFTGKFPFLYFFSCWSALSFDPFTIHNLVYIDGKGGLPQDMLHTPTPILVASADDRPLLAVKDVAVVMSVYSRAKRHLMTTQFTAVFCTLTATHQWVITETFNFWSRYRHRSNSYFELWKLYGAKSAAIIS